MVYKDVKYMYTKLPNPELAGTYKVCSKRKIFVVFIILILCILTLIIACYSHSTVCLNGNLHIKHTKRRLPHCLIIGARKAGTRALITYLRLHPDIQTAQHEVHFFDNDGNHDFGYEWYRKQMPYSFKDQLTIEKTPAYFTEQSVPAKVYNMNSTIKLILIVRDPVERSISDQLQLTIQRKKMGLSSKSFEELAIIEDTGEIDLDFKPIKRSFYDVYMKNWLHHFTLNQFHIIDSNELINDPFSEVYKIETFLGIRHAISKESFVYNETKGFYCVQTETGTKCLSGAKGRTHPDVDESVINKLSKLFWKHNENFYKMVNRTFDWNKD